LEVNSKNLIISNAKELLETSNEIETTNSIYFNLNHVPKSSNTNKSVFSGVNIPFISGQDWLKRSVKVLEVTFRDRQFCQ